MVRSALKNFNNEKFYLDANIHLSLPVLFACQAVAPSNL